MSSGGLSYSDMGKAATVAGMSREFYERIGRKYNKPLETQLEPHIAEQVFDEMVKEAGVTVLKGEHIKPNSLGPINMSAKPNIMAASAVVREFKIE